MEKQGRFPNFRYDGSGTGTGGFLINLSFLPQECRTPGLGGSQHVLIEYSHQGKAP
ncbi:MAG: hypothetical protein CAPSK01_001741 [Candidatus Accumulibacter vicinus]|uniref:Uncharacterized protein n=1 Tax=Candidatus Accumulibacter vicinus TaxID=2954382 RepID=A0A084Y2E2_9PROT|nr:MAG: hypothetical protein CAPSK01_001741 [Candidatus Accumulibacter vicinus]